MMADSMREALTQAWEAAEAEEDTTEEVVTDDLSHDTPSDEPSVEEAAAPENTEDSSVTESDEPTEESTATAVEETAVAAEETAPAVPDTPAPQRWKPAAREHWAAVPEAVRAEITRREKEIDTRLNESAAERKFARQMQEVIEPFRQVMQMEGADEFQAIGNLGRFAQTMRLGTPQQKAQTVATLISSYGVDIPTLDQVLSGEVIPEEQRPFHDMLQKEIQPLKEEVNMWRQRAQQISEQRSTDAMSEVEQFAAEPGHEFYNDVESSMADLLEMAAHRGQAMTLQQAYDTACWMNPEVRSVLQGRQTQASTETPAEALAKRKAAAASLKPSRTNGAGQVVPDHSTTRGALMDAWARAEAGEL